MALLRLDSNNLNLDVLVGANESYEPTSEIKKISKEIEALKDQTNDFIAKTWNGKSVNEVKEIIDTEEDDKKKWLEYMNAKYTPTLNKIQVKVVSINERICPSFKEYMQQNRPKLQGKVEKR